MAIHTARFFRDEFSLFHAEIWSRETRAVILRIEYTQRHACVIWRAKQ